MLKYIAIGGVLLLSGASGAYAETFADHMHILHARCDSGDRGACVRFGIEIGRHQEKMAEWHQSHPDWFWYEH